MEAPLLLSKRNAAASLGISLRTLEMLISIKELKSVRIGKRRLIPRRELEKFARRDHVMRINAPDRRAAVTALSENA